MKSAALDLTVTKKQRAFIDAGADEVLYGGAAGGGKSYGQVIDALLYALRFKGSKQLILRRTYPELEKSLIRASLALYPKAVYRYSASSHTGRFQNGSILDFGHCESENDVYKYQSAEYDVIRFDELTHFSETMYLYLLSRLRGANAFPKQIKSSTNPGGVGHGWVKARFIDTAPPETLYKAPAGSRIYIPSRTRDNPFLIQGDPGYLKRLENLPEREKKALLCGNWDLFEGQYFSEFDRRIHTVRPFEIPLHWRRYGTLDYGLDMLAAYLIALDESGRAYVLREVYQSGLIVSEAAARIRQRFAGEEIYAFYGPPDLWNRHSDTGRSTAELFALGGIPLVKANNERVQGWLNLKEWLRPVKDEQGQLTARLQIFESCRNLIRTLPALSYDKVKQNDVAGEPHELTHAPDAIRYFLSGRPGAAAEENEGEEVYEGELMRYIHY